MITKRHVLVAVSLAVLFTITLIIRAFPLITLGHGDVLDIVAMDDPMYNLRLVEWVLQSGPAFPIFDVMTFYPYAQTMPWGPVFTWVSALFPYLTGAVTQSEIITASLWAPQVLAALLVPAVYLLCTAVWDWKAGLAGAVFIAFVGGQFFSRSLAGYLDHHTAEVLFGTVFALLYIVAVRAARKVETFDRTIFRHPALWFSAGAGVAYAVGFLNMPTMVMFAVVAVITTTVLAVYDFSHGKSPDYLLLVNGVVFTIAALVSLVYAYVPAIYGLTGYTIFHTITYILIIVWTAILIIISLKVTPGHPVRYLAAITGLVLTVLVGMAVLIPETAGTFMNGVMSLFGFNQVMTTIQEARPWTFAEAWSVYNFGFILMIGGFIVLLYRTMKRQAGENVFILVWSAFIIIATFRQVRYEYYLAVNIAILSAICVAYFIDRAVPVLLTLNRPAAGKKVAAPAKAMVVVPACLILLFAFVFVGTSAVAEVSSASAGGIRLNQDWRETLEWMNGHTPDPGVGYYTVYDEDTFTYPDEAYSVMSWWDYGHMITYIGHRIPVANPFQEGVAGPYGAARFFMTSDEEELARLVDTLGIRYVVTDVEMATGKFWAMSTWYNSTAGNAAYQPIILTPAGPTAPDQYTATQVYTDEYFMTTIARLHAFDGSLVVPAETYYIETRTVPEAPYPVAVSATVMNVTDAHTAALNHGPGALVASPVFIVPTREVPALGHFRLVYESMTNVFSGEADVRYVKVFEYVPGAVIPGDGVIEHPVMTNTGRKFMWRAASVNGAFTVPYPGTYTVVGTGRVVEVTEGMVMGL